MKPLVVVACLDGRLGHEKQTRGLLAALARHTLIEVTYQTLNTPAWTSRLKDWATYCVSLVWPAASRCQTALPRADLVIGTGSAIHIPMLLLKKSWLAHSAEPVRLVTCMTPDFPLASGFDLCLVPRHDKRSPAGNIFETAGPPSPVVNLNRHDRSKGLILIGGLDPASHSWDSIDLLSKIRVICERTPDLYWTLSSSPRTPAETIDLLREFVASHDNMSFYTAEKTPAGWIEQQYAVNRVAWVTADSVSMIYEALAGGCLVGILPVKWKRRRNKFQASIDSLVAENLALSYDAWQRGCTWGRETNPPDEADRCAREILSRWWPERISPSAAGGQQGEKIVQDHR